MLKYPINYQPAISENIVNNSISLQDSNLYHVPVAYGARTGEAWVQQPFSSH